MYITKKALWASALALLLNFTASAVPITFGNVGLDLLSTAGVQSEAGFNYQATGTGWELETIFSNPGAALATFFNTQGTLPGQTVSFTLAGGGLFTFSAFDLAGPDSGATDPFNLVGFVSGVPTQLFSGSSNSGTFLTFNPGFTAPIDRLDIVATGSAGRASIFDNLQLSAVATPEIDSAGSLLPLSFCAILLGLGRRRTSE